MTHRVEVLPCWTCHQFHAFGACAAAGALLPLEETLEVGEGSLAQKVEMLGYALSACQDALFKVIANQERLEVALRGGAVGKWTP